MKSILFAFLAVLALAEPAAAQTKGRAMSYAELKDALASGAPPLVFDVRTAEEYAGGHLPGAVLFPYDEIQARSGAFRAAAGPDLDRTIVVYCRSGRRSAIAADAIAALGYRKVRDLGSIGNWKGKIER